MNIGKKLFYAKIKMDKCLDRWGLSDFSALRRWGFATSILYFLGQMTLFYLSDLDDLTVNAGGTGLV